MLALLLAAAEPDDVGYVYAAYGVVIVVLVTFAALTIARGRRLGRQLPPEDRRWM